MADFNYIVSYDLRGDGRDADYDDLHKALKTNFKARPLLESVWGLSSKLTCQQLHDRICCLPVFEDGDRLIVVRSCDAWGSNLKG